jgi:hypothetical protein
METTETVEPHTDPDERLELAYDAAVKALEQQAATLNGLRGRATGVLSTAALVISFATGLGIFGTDPNESLVLPRWDAYSLLGLVVVIGVLCMFVVWPKQEWHFGPAAETILERVDLGMDINEVRRVGTERLTEGRLSNELDIKRRALFFQIAIGLLIVEVALLIAGILSA